VPTSIVRRARIPAALLALILPACAGTGGHRAAHGPVERVDETDFRITAPHVLRAGPVTLKVDNDGPVYHELIIVRASSAELPLRSDGITANEEVLEPETIASLVPGAPGKRRTLRLDLAPGNYQLFCNMNGHYRAGMHTDLVVQ
jgi:hypothetical protein